MKKIEKYNQSVNIKSLFVIGFLFVSSLMFASTKNATSDFDGFVKNPEDIKEVELKLENWMLSVDLFKEKMVYARAFLVVEQEVDVEPWMLDPVLFSENIKNNGFLYVLHEVEIENEIEVESWMLNPDEFSNKIR